MNFGLKHIEHFILVARELHYRRAAEIADVPQPAISRSVQFLENELGVELLARNNRTVKLTDAGKKFLEGCIQYTHKMSNTIEQTQSIGALQNDAIRIGYTSFAMRSQLPQLLGQFNKKYPDIVTVPIHLNTTEQLEQLKNKKLDACFITTPAHAIDAEYFNIHEEETCVVVNEKHAIAQRDSVAMAELKNENIIIATEEDHMRFHQNVRSLCTQAGVKSKNIKLTTSKLGALGLVANDSAITFSSKGCPTPYQYGLISIPVSDDAAILKTVMAWNPEDQSETQSVFLQFFKDALNSDGL